MDRRVVFHEALDLFFPYQIASALFMTRRAELPGFKLGNSLYHSKENSSATELTLGHVPEHPKQNQFEKVSFPD